MFCVQCAVYYGQCICALCSDCVVCSVHIALRRTARRASQGVPASSPARYRLARCLARPGRPESPTSCSTACRWSAPGARCQVASLSSLSLLSLWPQCLASASAGLSHWRPLLRTVASQSLSAASLAAGRPPPGVRPPPRSGQGAQTCLHAALCATVSRRRLPWCAVPRSPLLSPLCFTACRVLFGPCAKQARRPSPLRSSALLSCSTRRHFGKLDPTNAGAACQRGTSRHQSPRPQEPITAPWLQLYDCTHR